MFDDDPEREKLDRLTEKIIGFGIDVHRALGPGLLESAYEECLCYELAQAGIGFTRQTHLPVAYKNVKLDCGYRMDVVVDNAVILEVKTVERLIAIHQAQLLSYLKMSGLRVGLLMNFHVPVFKSGLKRIVNNY
jgi:GxxExxY protein